VNGLSLLKPTAAGSAIELQRPVVMMTQVLTILKTGGNGLPGEACRD
jgi:hypothetical protein